MLYIFLGPKWKKEPFLLLITVQHKNHPQMKRFVHLKMPGRVCVCVGVVRVRLSDSLLLL